eukprot:jgi/Bigna1/140899/aug1.59_g15607
MQGPSSDTGRVPKADDAIQHVQKLGKAFRALAQTWIVSPDFKASSLSTCTTADVTRWGACETVAETVKNVLKLYAKEFGFKSAKELEKRQSAEAQLYIDHYYGVQVKKQQPEKMPKSPCYYDIFEVTKDAPKANDTFIFDMEDVKFDEVLGKGNFATTYRATISKKGGGSGRQVALKVPNDGVSSEECKKEMMGLLNVAGQRNIMEFVGIMEWKGQQCFLTELCELGSMDGLHEKLDLREEKTFIKIAKGLFLGLMHLHHFRIIHRDIACRNLLVKPGFEVRIADFGLAVRAPQGTYSIMPGVPLPWPWMPPETLKTAIFTPKSDIWAAGVTLWEILHKGKSPYASELQELSVPATCKGIINGEITLGAPKEATKIQKSMMLKCLECHTKIRPDACSVLLDHIRDGLEAIRKNGTKAMKDVAASQVAASVPMVRMRSKRADFAAVGFDKRVYVVGGAQYEEELKSAESLSTNGDGKESWEKLPEMNVARSHVGAAVWDGKLYAGGGIAGYEDAYTSVEVLDLRDIGKGWSMMPVEMSNGGMLCMTAHSGKLYALTHGGVETLNLSDVQAGWATISLSKSNETPEGIFVHKEKLYVLSGGAIRWTEVQKDKNMTCGKLKKLVDSEGKAVTMPNGESSATVLWNDCVLAIGGGYPPSAKALMLDLNNVNSGWKSVANMATRKANASAVAVGGNVVVLGGKADGSPLDTVENLRVALALAVRK